MDRKMSTIRIIIASAFFLVLRLHETNACNEKDDIFPCTCALINDRIKVDCASSGLRTVPENLPEGTTELYFSDNLLQPDNVDTLCRYKKLERVWIARNHLTSIEPRGLRKCNIKVSVDFSGNSLEMVDNYTLYGLEFTREFYGLEAREFKENAFTDMYGLKILEMITHQNIIPPSLFKRNHIERLEIDVDGAIEIPATLFSPLSATLMDVTIKSRSIQTLPANLLSDLKILKMFALQVEELRSIPSTMFQYNPLSNTVENITLSGIKSYPRQLFWLFENLHHLEIHEALDMPSELFHELFGLESLDLSTSSVSALPAGWFSDLESLHTLILHDVGLTVLTKDDFKELHAIKKLDLSKNGLRYLSPEVFHYISGSVKFINISINILKTVPKNLFKSQAGLECLDISRNQIYSIEKGAFYQLSELKRLYLQSNKLYNLDSATFVYNVNMTYLDMSSNILIDLPGELFSRTHRLLVFNLSDNRIRNLERSIKFYIPTLREINFSYNPIECDCRTVAVVKKLLLNAGIIGDCENPHVGIAIVDFVSDANCLPNRHTNSSAAEFISSTVFQHHSEGSIEEWESNGIISNNNVRLKLTRDSKLSAASVLSVTLSSAKQDLSVSRISDFTIFQNQSSKVKLNDLPITKHVSELATAVYTTVSITPTQTLSTIKNSTSGNLNHSQVYSSSNVWDLKVNITQDDDGNSKLINSTRPIDNSSKTQIDNDQGGVSTLLPDVTLEPSFQALSETSNIDKSLFLTETLSKVLQTKSKLSENGTVKVADVGSISPTSALKSEIKDDKAMTDGFHNSSETIEISLNGTALPPELGYGNITGDPKIAGKGEKSDYFYLSLASIVSVAVFSVLILVFLYYKRKRGTDFEIERRRDVNIYNVDEPFNEDDRVTPRSALCPLKDVPSIQIESVDDEGNIQLEFYPISKS